MKEGIINFKFLVKEPRREGICIRGHPHSTSAQKPPKFGSSPPLYAVVSIWLDPSPRRPFMLTYFLYYSPPLTFLINFYSDSSFRHSQLLGYFHFYLSLRLNFTKPISKRFLLLQFIAQRWFTLFYTQ